MKLSRQQLKEPARPAESPSIGQAAQTQTVMNDAVIRERLIGRLKEYHTAEVGTVLMEELGLCCGAVRVDVAVATPTLLHGYEIKGETDTLKRLPFQIEVYSGVLDRATLVLHETHLKHAQAMVPDWWGLTVVLANGGFDILREEAANPAINPRWLVESIWRNEAYKILESRRLHKGCKSKPKHNLYDILAVNIPIDELRFEVRTRIRTRPVWNHGRFSVGPEPWGVPISANPDQRAIFCPALLPFPSVGDQESEILPV